MGVEAELSETEQDRGWTLRGSTEVVQIDTPSRDSSAPVMPMVPRIGASEGQPRRDWAAALTLVQEAAEAIRLSEERVEELKREADNQARQHHSDLTTLHAQLVGAQREIEAANARAQAAEQRAKEANDWLTKLDDAINSQLGGTGRS